MGVEKDQFELTRLAAACNCKPFLLSTSPHFIAPIVYDNNSSKHTVRTTTLNPVKYQQIEFTGNRKS
jgi:hypothetical protein